MINLLKYYAKKRIIIVGIISTILLLLSLLMFQDGFVHGGHPINNPVQIIGVCSIILSLIIPVFEFSFKMRKVGIDEFYKYPITRKKLFLTKYIVGLLEVIIPITSFWLFMLIRIVLSEHMFIMSYYFLYFIVLLGLIFIIYTIVTFIYSKCNTIYDGLICIALATFLTFVVGETISTSLNNFDVCLYTNYNSWYCPHPNDYFIFSPIAFVSNTFRQLMENYEGKLYSSEIQSLVIYSIISVISFILFIVLSDKEKAENSMDISSSWFSYKTFIPIYIVYLSTDIGSEAIYIILIAIIGYIGYAIYRRSFKIKLCDIITMSVCITIGFIIANISLH